MENSTKESGGGGSGGPKKFLVKIYQMVDDPCTDNIVSWSQRNNSFIIKDSDEFSSNLLKKYFTHNNFSSFIRQLNSYGFHKIKQDQWEFANEYFLKDQYHLLDNIHRKKPVHSHSRGEVERFEFEEEIKKLSNEKAAIELDISNFELNMPAKKLHVDNLVQRLEASEHRHNNLKNSFEMVLQNPKFVEEMNKKVEFIFSSRFSNKRPFIDAGENAFVGNSSNFGLTEVGNSLTNNDNNFGSMEVENDFADIDTNFRFIDFGNLFDEYDNYKFMEEGDTAHDKVMGEGGLSKKT
ncbi:unnamed protein product [Lathyrus sativus]|nr:unnamed protein product [Lathyrus sativus]